MIAHLKLMIARLRRDGSASRPSAAAGCSTSWNCSSRSWRRAATEDAVPPRTGSGHDGARAWSKASPAASRCAPRCRRICRASASSSRRRPPARAVGGRLAKLGEDITETLEVIPRQWKVIQTVREKFTCRACETITQPPAPFHPIARGRAGPELLAMILYRQVRPAPAAQPAERELRPRGHRSRRLDAGRLGRRLRRDAGAAGTS